MELRGYFYFYYLATADSSIRRSLEFQTFHCHGLWLRGPSYRTSWRYAIVYVWKAIQSLPSWLKCRFRPSISENMCFGTSLMNSAWNTKSNLTMVTTTIMQAVGYCCISSPKDNYIPNLLTKRRSLLEVLPYVISREGLLSRSEAVQSTERGDWWVLKS